VWGEGSSAEPITPHPMAQLHQSAGEPIGCRSPRVPAFEGGEAGGGLGEAIQPTCSELLSLRDRLLRRSLAVDRHVQQLCDGCFPPCWTPPAAVGNGPALVGLPCSSAAARAWVHWRSFPLCTPKNLLPDKCRGPPCENTTDPKVSWVCETLPIPSDDQGPMGPPVRWGSRHGRRASSPWLSPEFASTTLGDAADRVAHGFPTSVSRLLFPRLRTP
jgi:hypothetical protein